MKENTFQLSLFTVKVIESSPEDKNPLQDDTLSTEVKKKGKRKNKIKSSSGSTNIIGLCNLDIQSIFLGNQFFNLLNFNQIPSIMNDLFLFYVFKLYVNNF